MCRGRDLASHRPCITLNLCARACIARAYARIAVTFSDTHTHNGRRAKGSLADNIRENKNIIAKLEQEINKKDAQISLYRQIEVPMVRQVPMQLEPNCMQLESTVRAEVIKDLEVCQHITRTPCPLTTTQDKTCEARRVRSYAGSMCAVAVCAAICVVCIPVHKFARGTCEGLEDCCAKVQYLQTSNSQLRCLLLCILSVRVSF